MFVMPGQGGLITARVHYAKLENIKTSPARQLVLNVRLEKWLRLQEEQVVRTV